MFRPLKREVATLSAHVKRLGKNDTMNKKMDDIGTKLESFQNHVTSELQRLTTAYALQSDISAQWAEYQKSQNTTLDLLLRDIGLLKVFTNFQSHPITIKHTFFDGISHQESTRKLQAIALRDLKDELPRHFVGVPHLYRLQYEQAERFIDTEEDFRNYYSLYPQGDEIIVVISNRSSAFRISNSPFFSSFDPPPPLLPSLL